MQFRYVFSPLRWPLPLVAVLTVLAAAPGSQAQTLYNASGSTLYQNGDLYNTGTFQNAGTYTPATGTLLIAGGDFVSDAAATISTASANSTVRLSEPSASQMHTLTLNGQALPNVLLDVPANTNLGSDGTINGTLTLVNGHLLTTSSNLLTLGSAATLAGETSAHYVKGRLAQTKSLSGSAAVDYGGIGVIINPGGNSLPLTVERRAGLNKEGYSYGVNPEMGSYKGIDRMWVFSSGSASTVSAPMTVTFSWLADNDNGLSFSGTNAQVWRSDNNGSTWQRQGSVQNGSSRTVSVTVTKLNSLYTVSSTAAPLPVSLVSFTATKQGSDGLLNWQTASEQNSAYFEVQASPDGKAWQVLTKVPAAGTSTTARPYSYLDKAIARYGAPVVYYRLRQVDLTGKETYAPVVTLRTDALAWQVTAYPNPFAANLTAQLNTAESGEVTLTLLDITSRVLLRRTVPAVPGSQLISLEEAGTLPTGSYILLVRQNEHAASLRLVHQ